MFGGHRDPVAAGAAVDERRVLDRVEGAAPVADARGDAGRKKNPALAGTLTIEYLIAGNGSVKEVKSKNATLPDKDVVSCVERVYTTMSFPRPKGRVEVTVPMTFTPEAAP